MTTTTTTTTNNNKRKRKRGSPFQPEVVQVSGALTFPLALEKRERNRKKGPYHMAMFALWMGEANWWQVDWNMLQARMAS